MLGRVDSLGLRLGLLWGGHRLRGPMGFLHRILLPGRFGPGLRMGRGSCVTARQATVGRNFKLGRNSEVVAEHLEIGDDVTIGDNTRVHCRRLVMKNGSKVGDRCVIWGTRTPGSGFELGEFSHIFDDNHLNTDEGIFIGDRTAMGSLGLIFTHSTYLPVTHGYPVKIAPVHIGSDVWLPWHAFILPGVTIGSGATVGAFSLVGADVPENALAVGVPARVVRDARSYRRRHDGERMRAVALKVIDSVVAGVCDGFRKRTLFSPDPRTYERIGETVWVLRDGRSEQRIEYMASAEGFAGELERNNGAVLYITAGLTECPASDINWADLVSMSSRQARPPANMLAEVWKEFSFHGIRFHWFEERNALEAMVPIPPPDDGP